MPELIINTHMHSHFSDGTGSHAYIAERALAAGLDAIIVTDHNIWVQGAQGYFEKDGRKLLLLVGEEIHDQGRVPQKNHLLVFGAEKELSTLAHDTQALIRAVRSRKGLTFLAHPHDPPMPLINEPDISWVDYQVKGFTGMEIWNDFSEFKGRIRSLLDAIFLIFNPRFVTLQPFREALDRWDDLTQKGIRVVAIGSSDAHELTVRRGMIKRSVFPYLHHFLGINNHVFTSSALSGNLGQDKSMIFDALRAGHSFVGYDRPQPTYGFRFGAVTEFAQGMMGDSLEFEYGATLQFTMPGPCRVHLLHDGRVLHTWNDEPQVSLNVTDGGVYRIEAYTRYLGKTRGWIFSNPIYLKKRAA